MPEHVEQGSVFRRLLARMLYVSIFLIVGMNLSSKLPSDNFVTDSEPSTERVRNLNSETWGIRPEDTELYDITANQANVFEKLKRFKDNISSVILRPSEDSRPLSIVPQYYQWTASPHLCKLLVDVDPENWMATLLARKYFAEDCKTDPNLSYHPNATMHPKYEKTTVGEEVEIFFPNITTYLIQLNYAFVPANTSAVYSPAVVFTPISCAPLYPTLMPATKGAKVEDTVFLLSQYAGETTYHSVAEGLTRIGPYLKSLRKRTDIKVHIGNHPLAHYILEVLGISKRRIIDGAILARTLLVPEGTSCGQPRPFQTQMFYQELQQSIGESHGQKVRDTIVLIKRSSVRRLINHDDIKEEAQRIAKEYGLRFIEYSDTNLPSFQETMDIFYRSVQIIAPHGAGLVNMFFARPGTFITEALCGQIHVNLCFQRLSYILGHHYQGVAESSACPDAIDVVASELLGYVRRNLEEWKMRGNKVFTDWTTSAKKIKWTTERQGDQSELDGFLPPQNDWFDQLQRMNL